MKYCPKCKLTKDVANFYSNKSRPTGYSNWCKNCTSSYNKSDAARKVRLKYSKTEKRKISNKNNDNNRSTNPERKLWHRKNSLKHKYNMTLEDYDNILKKQGYICAICKMPLPLDYSSHVDHGHAPPFKIRGILCNLCNPALGLFKDSKTTLANAIKYLEVTE